MVWDGECRFCHYWVVRWEKMTGEKVDYRPYDEVADHFSDIETKAFQQAVRLIDANGKVYSGAAAAFKAFDLADKYTWLWSFYTNNGWFRYITERAYNWVAKHRQFMFELTRWMFGSNPLSMQPLWLIYLLILAALLIASI